MIIPTQFVNSLIMKSFNRIKDVEAKLEKNNYNISRLTVYFFPMFNNF